MEEKIFIKINKVKLIKQKNRVTILEEKIKLWAVNFDKAPKNKGVSIWHSKKVFQKTKRLAM